MAEALDTTISDNSKDEVPEWLLAKRGLQLILNNKQKEGESLFKQYPDSIQMYAGYSVALFMDALMTFEDDKLVTSLAALKEVERRCSSETGFFKSVRMSLFGSSSSDDSYIEHLEKQIILADCQVCIATLTFLQQDFTGYFKGGWVLRKAWKIYEHIYQEIRNLYRLVIGELPDAISYSIHSDYNSDEEPSTADASRQNSVQLENNIKEIPVLSHRNPSNGYIYNTQPTSPTTPVNQFSFANNTVGRCSCNNNPCKLKHDASSSSLSADAMSRDTFSSLIKKSKSVNSALCERLKKPFRVPPSHSDVQIASAQGSHNINNTLFRFASAFNIFALEKSNAKTETIDRDTVKRLMGAVSFGYGLFQLGLSLLPPSVLKFTNIFGFGADRQKGLLNLMYARGGVDMRAPLATLSLLWYHTIVRPFYAVDGSNVQAGVEIASYIINESYEEYKESALFLFFKGRVSRLKSDISGALQAFQASVQNSAQREIKVLSLHEVGWCYLIQLDYDQAQITFENLKTSSRWSKAFYVYLEIICAGSCNKLESFSTLHEIANIFDSLPKGTQLENFLLRRYKSFPTNEEIFKNIDDIFWKLLVYELLYLWNTLPSCLTEDISQIILNCDVLIEQQLHEPMVGLSYLIKGACHSMLNQYDIAAMSFAKCLELRQSKNVDDHHSHISTFALYEYGTIMLKEEETKEEGKRLLHKVFTYSHYDFEQRLNVRVHSILKNL